MTRRPELIELVARALSPNIWDERSAQYPDDAKPRERSLRRAVRILEAIEQYKKDNQ